VKDDELYLHSPIRILGIGLNYIIKYKDSFAEVQTVMVNTGA
jgi:hypothetical protein